MVSKQKIDIAKILSGLNNIKYVETPSVLDVVASINAFLKSNFNQANINIVINSKRHEINVIALNTGEYRGKVIIKYALPKKQDLKKIIKIGNLGYFSQKPDMNDLVERLNKILPDNNIRFDSLTIDYVGDNCLCLKAKPHSISYIGSVKLY
jgi:hypothetical protein